MRTQIFYFFIFILLVHCISAQDIIIKTNGEELKVKIINSSKGQISYQMYETEDHTIYSISEREIFLIKYSDGTKKLFAIEEETTRSEIENENEGSELDYKKGKEDAKKYYQRYNEPAAASFVSGLFLGAIFSLPIVIPMATIEPQKINLSIPDKNMFKYNKQYRIGYEDQAFKTKRNKVLINYAIGGMISTILLIVFFASN